MGKTLVLAASAAVTLGSLVTASDADARHIKDSIGTTATLGCAFREGPMRTPCSLRTRRLRAPTTTRAYRTFSLERGVDVLR